MAIKGLSQLLSRFEAISPNPKLMRNLALTAVREQKIMAPYKTGNLRRSIMVGAVTDKYAETRATANYAAAVELGTRPHVIRPRNRKALRFAAGGSGRLSGSPRSGGPVIFAKKVNHPVTKAKPYMVPGATKAVRELGADFVVRAWNDAA